MTTDLPRRRNQALAVAFLLLAGACSGGGAENETERSSLTRVSRSIIGIVPATGIGEDGQPVDPGFTFAPDAPQVTIVAQAGEVTGSPMDLTWFQVTEEGEEELFTHTVEVGSFQAAYSVGESPGTLSPGTYRVDVTFEGETGSTRFEVQAPEGEPGDTGQGATSGPPASGDSGAVGTPISEVLLDKPLQTEASVGLMVFDSPVDYHLPRITFVFHASLPDGRVEAQATMGGSTRTVSFETFVGLPEELDFNPCAHPGGSDLPGTEATFTASVFEGESSEIVSREQILTVLGPDETPPEVTINSDPPNKSRVEPGDEIVLDATALEHGFADWQEGLRSFKLIAKPGGPVGQEQRSDSGSPQPCGRKQWNLASQATYTVPDDAPPVIKICGEALDFAGNFSDPDACNEYYTGEVWEGTLTGHSVVGICSPSSVPVTGDIKIVVGGDGTLTGSSTRDAWVHTSCRFADGSLGPIPIPAQTFPISGRKTDEAFVIKEIGTLSISGARATGTFTFPHGFGELTHTYSVECVSCE